MESVQEYCSDDEITSKSDDEVCSNSKSASFDQEVNDDESSESSNLTPEYLDNSQYPRQKAGTPDSKTKLSNEFSPVKTKISSQITTSTELKECENDKFANNSANNTPLLGKIQAKRRLQAFTLTKKELPKIISPLKQLKKQAKKEQLDENGQNEKNNKSKSGMNHLEKAKKVISEIEEMKKMEADKIDAIMRMNARKRPRRRDSKDFKKNLKRKRSKSKTPRDDEKTRRSKQKSKERRRSRSRESNRSRSFSKTRSATPKTKTIDMENVKSWRDFRKMKKKLGTDNIRLPLRKCEKSKNRASLDYLMNGFEGEVYVREPFAANSVDGARKFFYRENLKFTVATPSINYSENPLRARKIFPTRSQFFNIVPKKRAEAAQDFLKQIESSTPKKIDTKVQKHRSWYPAEALEPIENSYPVEPEIPALKKVKSNSQKSTSTDSKKTKTVHDKEGPKKKDESKKSKVKAIENSDLEIDTPDTDEYHSNWEIDEDSFDEPLTPPKKSKKTSKSTEKSEKKKKVSKKSKAKYKKDEKPKKKIKSDSRSLKKKKEKKSSETKKDEKNIDNEKKESIYRKEIEVISPRPKPLVNFDLDDMLLSNLNLNKSLNSNSEEMLGEADSYSPIIKPQTSDLDSSAVENYWEEEEPDQVRDKNEWETIRIAKSYNWEQDDDDSFIPSSREERWHDKRTWKIDDINEFRMREKITLSQETEPEAQSTPLPEPEVDLPKDTKVKKKKSANANINLFDKIHSDDAHVNGLDLPVDTERKLVSEYEQFITVITDDLGIQELNEEVITEIEVKQEEEISTSPPKNLVEEEKIEVVETISSDIKSEKKSDSSSDSSSSDSDSDSSDSSSDSSSSSSSSSSTQHNKNETVISSSKVKEEKISGDELINSDEASLKSYSNYASYEQKTAEVICDNSKNYFESKNHAVDPIYAQPYYLRNHLSPSFLKYNEKIENKNISPLKVNSFELNKSKVKLLSGTLPESKGDADVDFTDILLKKTGQTEVKKETAGGREASYEKEVQKERRSLERSRDRSRERERVRSRERSRSKERRNDYRARRSPGRSRRSYSPRKPQEKGRYLGRSRDEDDRKYRRRSRSPIDSRKDRNRSSEQGRRSRSPHRRNRRSLSIENDRRSLDYDNSSEYLDRRNNLDQFLKSPLDRPDRYNRDFMDRYKKGQISSEELIDYRNWNNDQFMANHTAYKESPNSPVDGLKRSIADSTISDSELVNQTLNVDDSKHCNKKIKYDYTVSASPIVSPKRLSLDDRINQVLGIDKEEPKQIESVYSQGTYDYGYYDRYSGYPSTTHYDGYPQPPGVNMVSPNSYYPPPAYPSEPPRPVQGSQVVQVGNVLQVVPTEMPLTKPQTPSKKVEHKEPKNQVVQVGNMLQIVPTVLPVPSVKSNDVHSEKVTETVEVEPKIEAPQVVTTISSRKAEKLKRRTERALRRKEREIKRAEKQNRQAKRQALKAERLIKKALTKDISGPPDLDVNDITESIKEENFDEKTVPTMWPPHPPLPAVLPQPPSKGILVKTGFSKLKTEPGGSPSVELTPIDSTIIRKTVKFADGIRPGEGTSPSGGEDLPSPPPPKRKLPKEQRYKKTKMRTKKKVKVKVVRQVPVPQPAPAPDCDSDSDDNLPPPPPPPGSPPPHLWPPKPTIKLPPNFMPGPLSSNIPYPVPPVGVPRPIYPPPIGRNGPIGPPGAPIYPAPGFMPSPNPNFGFSPGPPTILRPPFTPPVAANGPSPAGGMFHPPAFPAVGSMRQFVPSNTTPPSTYPISNFGTPSSQ